MDIFSKTAGFSKEVDSAMSTFKSTITKLKATAEKAIATKAEKQEEIKKLETALDGVSTKVSNLAAKLEALFE